MAPRLPQHSPAPAARFRYPRAGRQTRTAPRNRGTADGRVRCGRESREAWSYRALCGWLDEALQMRVECSKEGLADARQTALGGVEYRDLVGHRGLKRTDLQARAELRRRGRIDDRDTGAMGYQAADHREQFGTRHHIEMRARLGEGRRHDVMDRPLPRHADERQPRHQLGRDYVMSTQRMTFGQDRDALHPITRDVEPAGVDRQFADSDVVHA